MVLGGAVFLGYLAACIAALELLRPRSGELWLAVGLLVVIGLLGSVASRDNRPVARGLAWGAVALVVFGIIRFWAMSLFVYALF